MACLSRDSSRVEPDNLPSKKKKKSSKWTLLYSKGLESDFVLSVQIKNASLGKHFNTYKSTIYYTQIFSIKSHFKSKEYEYLKPLFILVLNKLFI